MQELKIDNEFEHLIPALQPEEYEMLEQSILKEGCREAILTWNDTIVDGHNRYRICQKNNLPFKTKSMDFDTRDQAKTWMIINQFGRRNISNYQRSLLALELEGIFKAKAKENQLSGLKQNQDTVCQKSDERINPIDTKKELAKVAQVSHDTIAKVKVIQEKAPEIVKQKVQAGEMSINEAYKHTKFGDAGFYARAEKQQKVTQDNPMPDEQKAMLDRLQNGETVVIDMNKHLHLKQYAEDHGLYVRIDRGSIWGNPFVLGEDGDRELVCNSYKTYYNLKPSLQSKISELKGKVLGCHCHPKQCHGHFLKDATEAE